MRFSQFVPPILVEWLLQRRAGMKAAESYAEALASCNGYEYERLVETIVAKTERAQENAVAFMESPAPQLLAAVLASRRGDEVHVLEFGGACGGDFSRIRPLLPLRSVGWHIVETPRMAERAQSTFATSELQFHSAIADAARAMERIDLVVSKGGLQYAADPLATLRELCALRAPRLYLSRIGVTEGPAIIAVQESMLSANGPGPLPPGIADERVRYPVTLVDRSELEETLRSAYAIDWTAIEQRNAYLARGRAAHLHAWLCRLAHY